ncbi:tetratricopeptide repeat protein [Taklimakanibacter deserti]|uniref:tetratricopeptide repeat protein n=1 Tax=Taklimakanibacter deserti TaxID=2267839 RepID=UPI000E6504C2
MDRKTTKQPTLTWMLHSWFYSHLPGARAFIAIWLIFFSLPAVCYAADGGYAGSASCAGCHKAESAAWLDSHHGWALREAKPENVIGDFKDATFTHNNITSRFFRRDGKYFIETDGADGRMTTFEVRYAVGIAPLQQYLVEIDKGRLQVLDIAWDAEKKSWYHLYPSTDVSAGNGLHWTGTYKNWQTRCAECHQTGFTKGYDQQTKSYQSRWAELTISCESCHGSAKSHVEWANDPARSGTADPMRGVLKLGAGQQPNELSVCGPCHARRAAFTGDGTPPGAVLGDHYNLSLISPGLYFGDGQQQDEVYVLGSFMQSKMMAKGVTCSNCHDPHSAKLTAAGDAICTQCHNATGRQDFPSLVKANYDTPVHHHHKSGTAGAQCVSCHMPERTYMGIDKRGDHFFRRPDPLQSSAADAPDACTGCHRDRTPDWAARQIQEWFPRLDRSWQDRAAFLKFDQEEVTEASLAALVDYALQLDHPAIVRASAVDRISRYANAALVEKLTPVFSDRSEVVRAAAASATRVADPAKRLALLTPLLFDPVRSVRQSAAVELAGDRDTIINQETRTAFERALSEYRAAREALADTPESQMALAGLALTQRDWAGAEASFKEAARLDPQLTDAWIMLTRLRSALGDEAGARGYLEAGLAKSPRSIELLLARAEAETRIGNDAEAVDWYRRILTIEPAQVNALEGLAFSALRMRNSGLALDAANTLRNLQPPQANALIISAIVAYALGDRTRVMEDVRRARALDPSVILPAEIEQILTAP